MKGRKILRALFLLMLGAGALSLKAQTGGGTHRLGIDLRPSYVIPTHDFFRGADGNSSIRAAYSVHLKYAFGFSPRTRWGQLYPHAYQGIGLSYHTYSETAEIGSPVVAYVFQGSRIAQLAPRLSLDYEWNFGASFGWKEYDELTNPHNEVVGSRINAYLNFGLLLNWQIRPHWLVQAGVDVTHFSNGNTVYPNAGVNETGFRVGVVRTFGTPQQVPSAAPAFQRSLSFDLVLYGATRKKGYFSPDGKGTLVPGVFAVAGINVAPMYAFNKYFRAGLSIDAQYDESANIADHWVEGTEGDDIKFYRPSFRESCSVGLSLRGELVMPVFSVNVGIGRNILYEGIDTNMFYQILALKAHVSRRCFLHVGYQLSKFRNPNNLMLGLGYSLN